MYSFKVGIAGTSLLGTVLLAETAVSNSWDAAIVKVAEHGMLALLVTALMYMQWHREQRLARESSEREERTCAEFANRVQTLHSCLESRDKFIQEQLMALVAQVHTNVQSCHDFRSKVLDKMEQ